MTARADANNDDDDDDDADNHDGDTSKSASSCRSLPFAFRVNRFRARDRRIPAEGTGVVS